MRNDKPVGNRAAHRAIALSVTVAAVGVLAMACSSSPASSVSAPTYAQVLALATCMRSHGVPNFPDPNASGDYTLTSSGSIEGSGGSSIDINSSQAQAAYGDCRHLLPGGPSISQLEQDVQQGQQRQAQALPALLRWEQCVRSHGEPDFTLSPGGQSAAPGKSAGVDPSSPQFQAALTACADLLPAGAHVSVHANASAS